MGSSPKISSIIALLKAFVLFLNKGKFVFFGEIKNEEIITNYTLSACQLGAC